MKRNTASYSVWTFSTNAASHLTTSLLGVWQFRQVSVHLSPFGQNRVTLAQPDAPLSASRMLLWLQRNILNYFLPNYTAWREYLNEILFLKGYLNVFLFCFFVFGVWLARLLTGYESIFISHSTFSFIATSLMPADAGASGQLMLCSVCERCRTCTSRNIPDTWSLEDVYMRAWFLLPFCVLFIFF